jgi:hypothetical protein
MVCNTIIPQIVGVFNGNYIRHSLCNLDSFPCWAACLGCPLIVASFPFFGCIHAVHALTIWFLPYVFCHELVRDDCGLCMPWHCDSCLMCFLSWAGAWWLWLIVCMLTCGISALGMVCFWSSGSVLIKFDRIVSPIR